MTAWVVIVAAGDGTRLGADRPKALATLAERTLLEWSLDAAESSAAAKGIVIVCGETWIGRAQQIAGGRASVRPGGPTRHESVRAGLAAVDAAADRVVIHDAARPLAAPELFVRCLAALDEADGAVCGVPVTDTVKRCDGPAVIETVDRTGLWRSQTPQAFRLEALREAMAAAGAGEITDEAVLLERAGRSVVVVPGDERNIKITTPADLAFAEALIR